MKHIFTLTLLFFLIATQLFAQENSTAKNQPSEVRSYQTQRLSTPPPVIDGKLDDACWQNNNWAGDFTQWIPKEGAKPSQKTTINIQYDDKNLYVAIRAYDNEPEKISKKAGRRDEFTGDLVGIDLDTYHDHRTGFEFNVSAAGQKIDLILTNPSNTDMSWDAVWSSKVGSEDSAWVAEFEIPLSQLRYSNEKEQTWGMHVWRWIDRFQEESDWEPQTSTGPGILYLFGHLEGISDLPKSRRIELMPYTSGKLNMVEKDALNPYTKDGYQLFGNIGLDAKIGLSSNFTADVTINPDFGQVESDPSTMNLTAFETFYDEKRPFFLEGKNIFNFEFDDLSIFYTRRIGHAPSYEPTLADNQFMKYPSNTSILSAVKFSGKTSKGLSVGVLQSITNNEKALISDGSKEEKVVVEPMSSYTVVRFQQDFNAGNTVLGGIITSKNRLNSDDSFDFMNKNAITGGIDFLHQWKDKEFYLNAKLIGSNIQGDTESISLLQKSSARYYQRPDANHLEFDNTLTQLSGQGGSIKIGKGSKGLWRYSTMLTWRSPGLELNDIGYMSISDHVKNVNTVSYFINQPKGIFRSFNSSFTQTNYLNTAFDYLSSQFTVYLYGQFLNKWALEGHVCEFPNSLDTRILRGGGAMKIPAKTHCDLKIGSDNSKKTAFSIYAFTESGSENSSLTTTLNTSFTYQPFNILKFSISVNYTSNDNELQYVEDVSNKNYSMNQPYVLGKIYQETLGATFRIDYNINPELSLQYYGSPYFTAGNYSSFKLIDNPLADKYSNRFTLLEPVLSTENVYTTGDLLFKNPDFSFAEFRSNLVFRWEYKPGSKLFLVWSNEKTIYKTVSNAGIGDAFSSLSNAFSNNLFMVKLNYWFSL
jgi:hypothetical protein